MKARRTYQVWALMYNERGEQTWQPVTRKYQTKAPAASVSKTLWLQTRIEEGDLDPEDEPDL